MSSRNKLAQYFKWSFSLGIDRVQIVTVDLYTFSWPRGVVLEKNVWAQEIVLGSQSEEQKKVIDFRAPQLSK